jgi:hypothetical protein
MCHVVAGYALCGNIHPPKGRAVVPHFVKSHEIGNACIPKQVMNLDIIFSPNSYAS